MKPSDPVDPVVPLSRTGARAGGMPAGWLSPVQLRAAAYLYGMESVPVPEAKVLQIGAGHMEMLVSFALAYPTVQVTVAVFSADDLLAERGIAQRAGVANLAFHPATPRQPAPESGSFDYILVPGIPGAGAGGSFERLLAVLRDRLSPLGIACVGYHTQPGWKAVEIVRDLMTLHAHGAQTDADLIGAARESLGLLADGLSPKHAYGPALADMVEQARSAPDEVLVRDYLMGGNARYLVEFADQAVQAGLAYVGDAAPELEIPAAFGAKVALAHSLFSLGKPKVLRQQYLDFAVGRKSRRSLLAREQHQDTPLPAPDPGRLKNMRLAVACLRIQPEHGSDPTYRSYAGRPVIVTTRNEGIANVIETLSHAWPCSLTFDELAGQTPCRYLGERSEERHEQAVFKALEFLLQQGVLRYTLDAGPYEQAPDRGGLRLLPEVEHRIAGQEGGPGPELIAINRWQEPVSMVLTDAERYLLVRLDAGTGFDQWAALLEQAHSDGAVAFAGDSAPRECARDAVAGLVERLKCLGLMTGTNQAWQGHFSQGFGTRRFRSGHRYGYLDALLLHARLAVQPGGMAGAPVSAKIGRALESDKDYAEFARLFNSASWSKAEAGGKKCLKRFGGNARVWHMQASALRHQGKLEEACLAMLRAVSLAPLDPMQHVELGVVYQSMDLFSEAEASYRRALLLDWNLYAAHSNLGNCLRKAGRSEEAEAHCRRAIEIGPSPFGAYSNLAFVLAERGRSAEAIEAYRQALAIMPGHMPSYSNLLFTLCHRDDIDAETLFQEHLKYGEAVRKALPGKVRTAFPNSRDPERRLRVGFVSGDLYLHAVANFVEPIWAHLDRQAVEIHVYSSSVKEDAVTGRLRSHAACWRRIVGMDDARFASLVRQDGIDVLFDLAGHTANNRLPAFAHKPAPVQASWIGYPGTTGLDAMDYYLLDRHAASPGFLDGQFTEKLVYLPSCFAFQPFPASPDANGLPAIEKGYFTFGSFNRASKIGRVTLDLWAQVLRAVPTAKMLIGAIDNPQAEASLARQFAERGIGGERLLFRRRAPMPEYLAQHHEVDIVLDSFPYTGGTTACHAIWMGLPVLTLRGSTRISCQAASVLGCAGLSDWVVDTPQAFVDSAVSWTRRMDELSRLRHDLRARLPAAFSDARSVSESLEKAIRQMWHRWCQGLPAESFVVDP